MKRTANNFGVVRSALSALVLTVSHVALAPAAQVPTTLIDFFQAGSQPNGDVVYEEFVSSNTCQFCHERQGVHGGAPLTDIYAPWQGSMMAQAARDPLFFASVAIANQDAAFAGDICLRCHMAGGWLAGRSEPTDGSSMIATDFDGVSCDVCHRMVNPVLSEQSPFADAGILASVDPFPVSPGGGNFVMDPFDRRRGPATFESSPLPPHAFEVAPFFSTSEMCATCHDVSNPVFMRQPDGTYAVSLESLDQPHATGNKYDMFPLERTYSEWLNSEFAATGVDMAGRYGPSPLVVRTCQDCHMPDTPGKACNLDGYPVRDTLASHELAGGNAWVQDMVLNLYPDDGLNPAYLEAGKAAAVAMLQRAATLEVTQTGNHVNVRITNETGHKLPTGYPEGRRMWISVKFYDDSATLLAERGYYDTSNAELTTTDTKVYEVHLGLDAAVAAVTGLPEGKGFHFAVANVVLKDNRVPPRGFTNAAFAAAGAAPAGVSYADGQYWDDTAFRMPQGTRDVTVSVYYQTASKEFITFLRDANITDTTGQTLFDQWEITGKSPPVLMASSTIVAVPFADGDHTGDGVIDLADHAELPACLTGPDDVYTEPGCAVFDFDDDGDVDANDVAEFMLVLTG